MSTEIPKVSDADMLRIGGELVRAAGAGDPRHPKLWRDIERAFAVAINSPTFRKHVHDLCAAGLGQRFDDLRTPAPAGKHK